MSYRVVLTNRAERQLLAAAQWWAENRDREQAARWLLGFQTAIESLSVNPDSNSIAHESEFFISEIRQLLFGLSGKITHRALFEIRENTVYVTAIRHVSQRDLTPDDL